MPSPHTPFLESVFAIQCSVVLLNFALLLLLCAVFPRIVCVSDVCPGTSGWLGSHSQCCRWKLQQTLVRLGPDIRAVFQVMCPYYLLQYLWWGDNLVLGKTSM